MKFFKMKTSIILIHLLFVCSCAWVGSYVKKINQSSQQKETLVLKKVQKACDIKPKALTIYASDMLDTLDEFLSLCMKDTSVNQETRIKRCFLDLAIYQMILRPDKINPFSKVFISVQNKDKISIFDGTHNKDTGYWKALWGMANTWGQATWFSSQINRWINSPQLIVKVTKGLELSIREFRALALKEESGNDFRQLYFRGDELISEGEDLPYLVPLKQLSSNGRFGNFKINFDLLSNSLAIKKKPQFSYFCNFDIDASMAGKVLTYPRPLESSVFALRYGDWFISMAAMNSSAYFNSNNKLLSYFFIDPLQLNLKNSKDDARHGTGEGADEGVGISEEENDHNNAIGPQYCYLKSSDQKNESLLLSSYMGRDPRQYLASTIQYVNESGLTLKSLEKIMEFPRHLLLLNPLRLGFEVDRATDVQIQKIMNLDIPVFNEKNLGLLQINGYLANETIYHPDLRGTQDYCSYEQDKRK